MKPFIKNLYLNVIYSFCDLCFLLIFALNLQKYKPFKGVKYITKAGKFQVRT